MKKGFTLLETLLVIIILLIITSISISSFYDLNSDQSLAKETSDILSLIEQARGQTLASKNLSSYGVYFASTSVTLFKGETYVAGTSTNEVYSLNPRTTLSSISLSGGASSLYFDQITGTPSATGTLTLTLVTSTTTTKIITIYATGLFQSN